MVELLAEMKGIRVAIILAAMVFHPGCGGPERPSSRDEEVKEIEPIHTSSTQPEQQSDRVCIKGPGRCDCFLVGPEHSPRGVFKKVIPEYPEEAHIAGVEGLVSVTVRVEETGLVESACAYDGPSMLRQAAATAVSQWEYIVTGKVCCVSTSVGVNFVLDDTTHEKEPERAKLPVSNR